LELLSGPSSVQYIAELKCEANAGIGPKDNFEIASRFFLTASSGSRSLSGLVWVWEFSRFWIQKDA
jgi:hypothetical protein